MRLRRARFGRAEEHVVFTEPRKHRGEKSVLPWGVLSESESLTIHPQVVINLGKKGT